jgi:GH25 family lysozyme M1 (1,4-beta-N-acetylmuramidase)
MSEGCDCYTKFQVVTDMSKVKASGHDFMYVKTTDGMTTRDTGGYGPAGRAAGIAMGAYGYGEPGDPVAQADLLMAKADADGLTDLGQALDLEAPFVPGKTATDFAIAYLGRIASRGRLPVFYANDSMMTYLLPAVRAAVPSVWPWIARYGAAPVNSWKTWQKSSSGSVPGISASAVDLNTGTIPYQIHAADPPSVGTLEDDMQTEFPAGQDVVRYIPCNGKSALYISIGFGGVVDGALWFVRDTNAAGGSYGSGSGEPIHVDPDRPGPIAVPPGTRSITAKLTSKAAFAAWCY